MEWLSKKTNKNLQCDEHLIMWGNVNVMVSEKYILSRATKVDRFYDLIFILKPVLMLCIYIYIKQQESTKYYQWFSIDGRLHRILIFFFIV